MSHNCERQARPVIHVVPKLNANFHGLLIACPYFDIVRALVVEHEPRMVVLVKQNFAPLDELSLVWTK
jgi:hypothetical protein